MPALRSLIQFGGARGTKAGSVVFQTFESMGALVIF